MVEYDLNNDFPREKEWLENCPAEEKLRFKIGGCFYDAETKEQKRVFTLTAARKLNLKILSAIQSFMIMSDRVDIFNNQNDKISFNNIQKAIDEHLPKETKEEIQRRKESLIAFEKAHPEIFGEIDTQQKGFFRWNGQKLARCLLCAKSAKNKKKQVIVEAARMPQSVGFYQREIDCFQRKKPQRTQSDTFKDVLRQQIKSFQTK